jgi:bifunctional non-homologous end joining protein LigD
VPAQAITLEVEGREIRVSNPDKILFPERGFTKLDLVNYYLAVSDGALVGSRDRPCILYRWPGGVNGEAFYQKRIPTKRPEWIQSARITFPSGRSAEMLSMADAAHLAWHANLACLDINPWPVRRTDVDHPDELRVDLDPVPEIPYADVCSVALVAHDVLEEHQLVGFVKTSGKRGMHVTVRIHPRWTFLSVRRAALALAREVERRVPDIATTAWWKEERHGVFVDYNQNARDRTTASAFSVRPVPDARVSFPLRWDEVRDVDPSQFRLETVPPLYEKRRDVGADIDEHPGSLDSLLELAARDEEGGLGDAPWPPHFPKGDTEPRRVSPSRRAKMREWERQRGVGPDGRRRSEGPR